MSEAKKVLFVCEACALREGRLVETHDVITAQVCTRTRYNAPIDGVVFRSMSYQCGGIMRPYGVAS